MRRFGWRWAIVTVQEVPVCNMLPPIPGEPTPEGFAVTQHEIVNVLRRFRRVAAAERCAPFWREGLLDAGRVSQAHGVEVWSREQVERSIPEPKVTVRV